MPALWPSPTCSPPPPPGLLMQALVSEYGEEEAQNILHDIYVNAGDHVESSGSAPCGCARPVR